MYVVPFVVSVFVVIVVVIVARPSLPLVPTGATTSTPATIITMPGISFINRLARGNHAFVDQAMGVLNGRPQLKYVVVPIRAF